MLTIVIVIIILSTHLPSQPSMCDWLYDVGNLVALEMLDLEDNFLEFLPSNIRSLQELKYLNAARNRIIDIPLELCLLKNLRKLNLERNKLIRLPELMGFMNKLNDVRVGYNRLEVLAEDLFGNPEGEHIIYTSSNNTATPLIHFTLY